MDTLYLNNDHVIEVDGLQDADGDYVSGANVRATLYEGDGVTEVTGVTWPLALTYRGPRGRYTGELSSTINVVDKGRYKMKLEADFIGKRFEVTRIVVVDVRYS